MNFGSVRSNRVKLFFFFWVGGGGGGGLYLRLIAYSNISLPPTLGWMGGGRINGTLRYIETHLPRHGVVMQ